jgi:hypothetical protein
LRSVPEIRIRKRNECADHIVHQLPLGWLGTIFWRSLYAKAIAAYVCVATQSDLRCAGSSWEAGKVLMAVAKIDQALARSYATQTGQDLLSLSTERPFLLVFLRHFG